MCDISHLYLGVSDNVSNPIQWLATILEIKLLKDLSHDNSSKLSKMTGRGCTRACNSVRLRKNK